MKTRLESDLQSRLESARRSASDVVRNFDIVCRILKAACRIYHLSLADLGSRRGPRHLTWPRQLCIYTIRLHTALTEATIAALFDCYSSNVDYAVKSVADAISMNPAALDEVAALLSSIGD
jgi:chromosomal replication initiation ATPase DnaA